MTQVQEMEMSTRERVNALSLAALLGACASSPRPQNPILAGALDERRGPVVAGSQATWVFHWTNAKEASVSPQTYVQRLISAAPANLRRASEEAKDTGMEADDLYSIGLHAGGDPLQLAHEGRILVAFPLRARQPATPWAPGDSLALGTPLAYLTQHEDSPLVSHSVVVLAPGAVDASQARSIGGGDPRPFREHGALPTLNNDPLWAQVFGEYSDHTHFLETYFAGAFAFRTPAGEPSRVAVVEALISELMGNTPAVRRGFEALFQSPAQAARRVPRCAGETLQAAAWGLQATGTSYLSCKDTLGRALRQGLTPKDTSGDTQEQLSPLPPSYLAEARELLIAAGYLSPRSQAATFGALTSEVVGSWKGKSQLKELLTRLEPLRAELTHQSLDTWKAMGKKTRAGAPRPPANSPPWPQAT